MSIDQLCQTHFADALGVPSEMIRALQRKYHASTKMPRRSEIARAHVACGIGPC